MYRHVNIQPVHYSLKKVLLYEFKETFDLEESAGPSSSNTELEEITPDVYTCIKSGTSRENLFFRVP